MPRLHFRVNNQRTASRIIGQLGQITQRGTESEDRLIFCLVITVISAAPIGPEDVKLIGESTLIYPMMFSTADGREAVID